MVAQDCWSSYEKREAYFVIESFANLGILDFRQEVKKTIHTSYYYYDDVDDYDDDYITTTTVTT